MLSKFKSMVMAAAIAFFCVGLVAQPLSDTLNSSDIVEIAQGVESSESCHDEHKGCGCDGGEQHQYDQKQKHKHHDCGKSHSCEHCDVGCDCDNCKCEDCKCSHCAERKTSPENETCGCQKKGCSNKCDLKQGDSGKSCHH